MRDATQARARSDGADEGHSERGVELDPEQLSPGALRGLIEEFVTREGTDYGSGEELGRAPDPRGGQKEPDGSLEDKVAQVYRQLSSGEARIVFDLESESASILCRRTLAPGGGSSTA